ncbi:hypothetical protein JGUZn3_12830 [Entomobacter blattae]|uniref:Uncharacterized protein n=1 Tax=Entomobacter blattae TaxID=2762277 RepID=A0A7H1NRU9_9PROT|nr:hypothetical protein JGUZn3_12830 [Entomobacter blattae]
MLPSALFCRNPSSLYSLPSFSKAKAGVKTGNGSLFSSLAFTLNILNYSHTEHSFSLTLNILSEKQSDAFAQRLLDTYSTTDATKTAHNLVSQARWKHDANHL